MRYLGLGVRLSISLAPQVNLVLRPVEVSMGCGQLSRAYISTTLKFESLGSQYIPAR